MTSICGALRAEWRMVCFNVVQVAVNLDVTPCLRWPYRHNSWQCRKFLMCMVSKGVCCQDKSIPYMYVAYQDCGSLLSPHTSVVGSRIVECASGRRLLFNKTLLSKQVVGQVHEPLVIAANAASAASA